MTDNGPVSSVNNAVLIIPVKSFQLAKQRLQGVLNAEQRHALGRQLAGQIVQANTGTDIMIVTDDAEVTQWALAAGTRTMRPPLPGLNAAVAHGFSVARQLGYERTIISHADLARPADLAWTAALAGIVLVTDRYADGTNVLVLPTAIDFDFEYGPGSFTRHYRRAVASNLPVHVVNDPVASHDLDVPPNLRLLGTRFAGTFEL